MLAGDVEDRWTMLRRSAAGWTARRSPWNAVRIGCWLPCANGAGRSIWNRPRPNAWSGWCAPSSAGTRMRSAPPLDEQTLRDLVAEG